MSEYKTEFKQHTVILFPAHPVDTAIEYGLYILRKCPGRARYEAHNLILIVKIKPLCTSYNGDAKTTKCLFSN